MRRLSSSWWDELDAKLGLLCSAHWRQHQHRNWWGCNWKIEDLDLGQFFSWGNNLFTFLMRSPEGLLLSDALMKSKTVLEDKDHEDALHQRKSLDGQLDCSPKRFLPPVVDHWDRVADHDVAEDNNPDRNETVVAKNHSQKKAGTAG